MPDQELFWKKDTVPVKLFGHEEAALELGSSRGLDGSNYNNNGSQSNVISSCVKGNNLQAFWQWGAGISENFPLPHPPKNINCPIFRLRQVWQIGLCTGAFRRISHYAEVIPSTFQNIYTYNYNSTCEDKCFYGNKRRQRRGYTHPGIAGKQ